MAVTSAQATLRGLDVNKVAVGFAEEDFVFKPWAKQTTTAAREIRWYQKTAGFLTPTSPAEIANVVEGARPSILEQSWTRQTSYVRKYFVQSPLITMEDEKDCDVDVMAGNIHDLTRAVAYQVDLRIANVLTDTYNASSTTINTVTANAAWNAASYTNVNIVEDIMEAKQKIRSYGFNPEGGVIAMNSLAHKSMITWLIDGKGSSIPAFASQKIETGVVMEILGLRVVVTEIITTDYAVVFLPQFSVKWKAFTPLTTAVIVEEGMGKYIRVWEEGEALLEYPRSVSLISNTDA